MNKKIKHYCFAMLILVVMNHNIFSQSKNDPVPDPNERQLAWQETGLGVLFSYGLHVFDGKKYRQSRNRINPIADYRIFDPKHLDTDQMKVISFIEDHKVIDKIIDHLKFTFMVERPPPSQVVQQELMMAAEERGDISKGLLSGLLSICGVKSILLLNTH